MRRLIRRSGITWLGVATVLLWLLVAAAIPFLAGVLVARAQEVDDPRFTPSSRSPRAAVLARAELEDLAARVWGPDLARRVAAVARCESTGRVAVDSNWPYVGLLQIDPDLHRERVAAVVGYPVALEEARSLLRDPLVNLAVGLLVFEAQGWAAWPACRWAS